jgi:hypothetical protein
MSHGQQGPTGTRGSAPLYNVRFQIIEVLDYFVVRDNFALPVRLHADGQLYDRNTRLQPHSAHYATRQEAIEVAVWLTDRAAGYPFNMLMAEWPRTLKFSDKEGATWRARTIRADAYDWTKGSSGQRD